MLLDKIAEYAIREQTSKLPANVVHHAKRAVIDWYAALLPGPCLLMLLQAIFLKCFFHSFTS